METRQVLILCAAVVSLVHAGNHEAYSGHTVHGVMLRNSSDAALLQRLQAQLELDLWQPGTPRERDALLMVAPHNEDKLLKALDDEGIAHYVHVDDVAKAIKKHNEEISIWRSSRGQRMIFQDYWRYAEIDAYMDRIAAQYPNLVTLVNAGKSYEGRDIKYLKISTTNFNDPSKPIYFMNAMIHAREWVTTPVTLYSIYRLVENLRSEDSDLLRDVDWIIMPLVNPDGYEYTFTGDRLWRKTRSINLEVSETCFGVDGNRNFDVLFGTTGVSSNPCALTYPGTHAFSEPETQYVRDILQNDVDRIQLYMDIHSHGNWVLFAYGDRSLPPNAAQVHHVAAAMGAAMDALKLPQAGFYRIGNSATILYGTSGSAQDYGQLTGVPFSYTLELPGYGYNFLVPPQFLDHINEETWQGIVVTARLARSYYRLRYNAATTTVAPTSAATTAATAAPTTAATAAPTDAPTTAATAAPTDAPTTAATAAPTDAPTTAATAAPTDAPTTAATAAPTDAPTTAATAAPTDAPTTAATAAPTDAPTTAATAAPTDAPTTAATAAPTDAPTTAATAAPTDAPTTAATAAPTDAPTTAATAAPTDAPTTAATAAPTDAPTTAATAAPTDAPTTAATAAPTDAPTTAATAAPTDAPTTAATAAPTDAPTTAATAAPTDAPTTAATAAPTDAPTTAATAAPTDAPTTAATAAPTDAPTTAATAAPTDAPTTAATAAPTDAPTTAATAAPTDAPTTAATATEAE